MSLHEMLMGMCKKAEYYTAASVPVTGFENLVANDEAGHIRSILRDIYNNNASDARTRDAQLRIVREMLEGYNGQPGVRPSQLQFLTRGLFKDPRFTNSAANEPNMSLYGPAGLLSMWQGEPAVNQFNQELGWDLAPAQANNASSAGGQIVTQALPPNPATNPNPAYYPETDDLPALASLPPGLVSTPVIPMDAPASYTLPQIPAQEAMRPEPVQLQARPAEVTPPPVLLSQYTYTGTQPKGADSRPSRASMTGADGVTRYMVNGRNVDKATYDAAGYVRSQNGYRTSYDPMTTPAPKLITPQERAAHLAAGLKETDRVLAEAAATRKKYEANTPAYAKNYGPTNNPNPAPKLQAPPTINTATA